MLILFFRLKAERPSSESSPFTISAKPGKTSKDKQLYSALAKTCGGCCFSGNAMYLLLFQLRKACDITIQALAQRVEISYGGLNFLNESKTDKT
jgi:hypothetical protein